MTAREEVLARIRAALGTGATGTGPPAGGASQIPRGYRTAAGLDTPALVALMAERLLDYGTGVRRCPPAAVPDAVRETLAERCVRRILAPAGLGPEVTEGLTGVAVITDDDLSPAALDAADGVITTAALAIAETGTIVLDGGPGQGRRALSLVPDYHLCVLHVSQIVAMVPEALARLDPGRPQTWISGPSATSDIELDRVQGVHGPRTLDVILAEP